MRMIRAEAYKCIYVISPAPIVDLTTEVSSGKTYPSMGHRGNSYYKGQTVCPLSGEKILATYTSFEGVYRGLGIDCPQKDECGNCNIRTQHVEGGN